MTQAPLRGILATPRRQAAVALLLTVPIPSLGVWMSLYLLPGTLGQWLYGFSKALMLAIPALWVLWVERRRWSLSSLRRLRGWQVGLASGALFSAVMLVAYVAWGDSLLDAALAKEAADRAGFSDPFLFAFLTWYVVFVNPLLEEYLWRWFVQTRLYHWMPARAAVPACAALFTVHHFVILAAQFPPVALTISLAAIFVGGLTWSWLYDRYRSIVPGYISHVVVDVVLMVLAGLQIYG